MATNQKGGRKDWRGKKEYDSDKRIGVDVRLVEYLYLSDFVSVIYTSGLFSELGYDNARKFEFEFRKLVKLRNTIAHPTKSLVKNLESCETLWGQLALLEVVLSHLS
jgi:hypothetical protein